MKQYAGELAEPLVQTTGFGAVPSQTLIDRLNKEYAQTLSEKFLLLFDHFGIDRDSPSQWVQLSLALAQAHVPGFKHRGKAGAKRQWTIFDRLQLRKEVDAMIEQKGQRSRYGVVWACSQLKDREPWKSRTASTEVLRRNFYYALSPDKLVRRLSAPAARVKK